MGYPEIACFDKIFYERTLENLKELGKCKNNFTFLLNSVLGLIILPNEILNKNKYKNGKLFNRKISDCREILEIFRDEEITIFQDNEKKIKKCIFKTNSGNEKKADNILLREVLAKMRNAFAHFGIEPTKMGDDWHGIILTNISKKNIETMKLYLDKRDLEQMINYIGNIYIELEN